MIGASSLSTLSVQAFLTSADGRPSDPGNSGLHNPHFAVPQKPPALPGTTTTSISYLYADGQQAVSSGIGLAGQLTEPDPIVSPLDYHSLGEITAESGDGLQIVELGWTVDRALNGDSLPHLFIYHWVNGAPTCYNGCGFVQVSKKTTPGMAVQVTTATHEYAIRHGKGGWWMEYAGDWFGYFPDSIWSSQGITFTQEGAAQWFGEVSQSANNHTQMGDGIFGSSPGSSMMNNLQIIVTMGHRNPAAAQEYVTNVSCYDLGSFTGHSFNFGGPGC